MKSKRILAAVIALLVIMAVPAYGATGNIKKAKVKISLSAGAECVTIKWNKISSAEGYQIYRASSKKGTYKKVKTITQAETVKHVDKKLKPGKTYYYKVRAYEKSGKKTRYSKFSEIKAKTPLTKKAYAKKCIGKSVKHLISAIGEPLSRDYQQSCFGPGEDGLLKYKGFSVYTYRENGKETVQSVE